MSLDDILKDPFQYPPREEVDALVAEAMSCLPASRRDLLSRVSHAIRTPLAAILGFREVLDMDPDLDPEERKSYQEIILSETYRLRRFVDTLKVFSVTLSGQLQLRREHRDLRETTAAAVERCRKEAETRKIRLEVISMPSPVVVEADHERLRLAIEHLVSNAIKATQKEGIIDVELIVGKKEIRLIVEDSGYGIHEESVERLFKPFQRIPQPDDNGGEMGLGLTIARTIAERHEGSVQISSSPMSGAKVSIVLPI